MWSSRALVARVEQAARAIESARAPHRRRGARVNAALLRAMSPAQRDPVFRCRPFSPGPAYPQPLLPSLAGQRELKTLDPKSDRYGFLLASLVRGRNRVDATLREAAMVLERP
jgi:hypothetical protein